MANNESLKYLIALAQFPKFGPRRLKALMARFPSAEAAFRAGHGELVRAGIEAPVAGEFLAGRDGLDPDRVLADLAQEGIVCLALGDPDYPPLLKEIYSAPYLLYVRGDPAALSARPAIAVVGTRKCSQYGERAAMQIAGELARGGVTVVSGLALGIDSTAHRAALEEGAPTAAVIGSGPDRRSLYPPQNACLADRIAGSGGAVISEFPPGTPPLRQNFPQRNRLIAGLTLGTLVVEAGERSGALITARFALEQDREVFAVPGSIYSPASAGPNRLIREGARPVERAGDILEALDLGRAAAQSESRKVLPANPDEAAILACLSREPVHVNQVIRASGLDTPAVNAVLTILEMKGMVRNVGRMQYVLAG